mmetsp:Transcript_8404/g.16740  ORF Transcript_8404/g.16740 Transcript_8404/m.16740 type:complete len:82 (+) Transcript_8404:2600-2845(+)
MKVVTWPMSDSRKQLRRESYAIAKCGNPASSSGSLNSNFTPIFVASVIVQYADNVSAVEVLEGVMPAEDNSIDSLAQIAYS